MTDPTPRRILLVEDNDDHAELVVRTLENHVVPNVVDRVADGAAALDFLLGGGIRPDLVLLDLRLPRVDGFEVLEEIKSHKAVSGIPVVILTTSQAEQDLVRAFDRHANAYVVKPVDFDAFVQVMGDLASFWLLWNQRPPVHL